jgi:hypothetical protein
MKKSELKNVIKPLVKECIHEVLLEEGLLSNVVSEVAKGLGSSVVVEQKQKVSAPVQKSAPAPDLAEHRKKLMSAINKDAYNGIDVFEGTMPIREAATSPGAPDLGAPDDAGIDISSIIGTSSKIWERLKQE